MVEANDDKTLALYDTATILGRHLAGTLGQAKEKRGLKRKAPRTVVLGCGHPDGLLLETFHVGVAAEENSAMQPFRLICSAKREKGSLWCQAKPWVAQV